LKTLVKKIYIFGLLNVLTLLSCQFLLPTSCDASKKKHREKIKIGDIETEAYNYNAYFSSFSHPFGSLPQKAVKDYIVTELKKKKIQVVIQNFKSTVPNRYNKEYIEKKNIVVNDRSLINEEVEFEMSGSNIIGIVSGNSKNTIIIASHYDTKNIEEFAYYGANDSGSSTGFILALIKYIQNYVNSKELSMTYLFLFTDGEESYLNDWNDSIDYHPINRVDNTYGSRYFVSKLKNKEFEDNKGLRYPIKSLILFDLIGEKGLTIKYDLNSDKELFELFYTSGQSLLNEKEINFNPFVKGSVLRINDDHIPFKSLQIPVIDIIDFTNIDHWHKYTDKIENISRQNFSILGKMLIATLKKLEKRFED